VPPVGLARLQACPSEVSWFTTLETTMLIVSIGTRYNRLGSRLLSVGKAKSFLSPILGPRTTLVAHLDSMF
jgi:hypothetical protein